MKVVGLEAAIHNTETGNHRREKLYNIGPLYGDIK
jgi:hypothetical protein